MLVAFAGALRIEGVHPLQLGPFRRKIRTQRRSGLPLENPLLFYPRWWFEGGVALVRWVALYLRYRRILARVLKTPDAGRYTDPALRPTGAGEADRVVEAFADIIPNSHGAPQPRRSRQPSAEAAI